MTTEAAETLRGEGPFIVGAHERPDGDSVGSMLALVRWLRERGRKADAVVPGGVPDPYAALPGAGDVLDFYPEDLSDTTLILVDTPSPDRVAGLENGHERAASVVVIDHHPDNQGYGDINLIDTGASSAALLLYETLTEAGDGLDAETATLLYTGVLTDTGGFRFGNTDERTLRAAAALVGCGARPAEVATLVYGSQPIGSLRLLGLVLSTVETALDGRLAFLTLTDEMRRRAGATGEEIEGLAAYGRGIQGVEVSVLLREEDGRVRLSMRSRGRVDVNALARRLGGGGHRAASGALVEGTIADARGRVIEALGGLLD
ncbi:MAG: bifunctional oligoribonuclease/PAP phosphatase NrnA [Candidatus Eisenbacteria bacterium]|nr:bifunctional oligoribonuclease/PAP phosphatase NrnA [Candidatus Eisenbacteria bacterium]